MNVPRLGPDRVGFAVPGEWFETFTARMNRVPNMDKAKISVHCHDDLGKGVASSLEALRAGASQVEGYFNGIGERAGNASLEEIIMALYMRPDDYGAETGIDLKQLYRTVGRGDSGWFCLLLDSKEKVQRLTSSSRQRRFPHPLAKSAYERRFTLL